MVIYIVQIKESPWGDTARFELTAKDRLHPTDIVSVCMGDTLWYTHTLLQNHWVKSGKVVTEMCEIYCI